ncbi:LysM peptidoglycan-binding domain-containing protein [Planomicrobium sp. CPCC 101110]|uniref:LysM peptidoglycan-binding domain-containing protein n=1 Tax=Planomicrobium sp. CPCC 101110 TaxID=2599619 RepID=UPI0011B579D7|nr:LysM peptidoglycan-binding domain-containing protein [Planomicrobium sp. CPCC 101110]TWT26266.1 LysM peptidoglycan-binding domain-containing protein [Planomicrobium sp. CPCC 101110]
MSSMTKRQKEIALIVLAGVFLLVLSAYSYFMQYVPAKEDRLQAEQTLSSEREVLMALETQLKEVPEGEKIPTSELQQKVSVEPLSELIVLQIEQAELISDSLVKDIAIAEAPVVLPVPVEGLENLQAVQTTVAIEATDYKGITTFIKEIEAMDRIMIVDSIDFSANEEVTIADQEKEKLEVSLSFSAYFRPDLIALADTLPKVDAPAPALKNNPLPQNNGTEYADTDEAMTVEEPEVNVDVEVNIEDDVSAAATLTANPNVAGVQTASTYKVAKGDSLFSIAIKHYNTEEGVEWIRQANNLADESIMAGQTLTIPKRP